MQQYRNNSDTVTHGGAHASTKGPSHGETPAPAPVQSDAQLLILQALAKLAEQVQSLTLAQAAMQQTPAAPTPALPLRPRKPQPVLPRDTQGDIMRILTEHGKATTADLVEQLAPGLPGKSKDEVKAIVHYHVGILEQQNLAITVRGVRNRDTGRRGPDVVYHHSAIAI